MPRYRRPLSFLAILAGLNLALPAHAATSVDWAAVNAQKAIVLDHDAQADAERDLAKGADNRRSMCEHAGLAIDLYGTASQDAAKLVTLFDGAPADLVAGAKDIKGGIDDKMDSLLEVYNEQCTNLPTPEQEAAALQQFTDAHKAMVELQTLQGDEINATNAAFDANDNATGCAHLAKAIDLTQQMIDQVNIMLPLALDAGFDPAASQEKLEKTQADLDAYQQVYAANCASR